MLETVNWLSLTVPIIAAGAAYMRLVERSWPRVVAMFVALTILTATLIGYTYLYRTIRFPLWMRWLV